MIHRNLLGIGATFVVALGVVGLTFSASVEDPADFRFINGTEPKSLDPQIVTGQPEGRIADAIFEGLTYREPSSLRPVPGAAESWVISEDQTVYTFTMRPDAVWSDGTPVTAHDFAWTWRRLQEPALGAEYAYILHMVKGAEIYNTYAAAASALEGPIATALATLRADHVAGVDADAWQTFVATEHVNDYVKGTKNALLLRVISQREGSLDAALLEQVADALAAEATRRRTAHAYSVQHFGIDEGVFARDDTTLVVELIAPTPYFLELTAFYPTYPSPRHIVEAEGNAQNWFLPGKIVTNGPFLLESWKVNDRIRLRKSATYWGRDDIHVEVVDAYSIENATTSLNLYLTGAVDWVPATYPVDLVDTLKKRPDFYKNPGMVVYYYRFNTSRPPFDDVRVRQAVCLSIDRKLIVEEVLGLGQLPATHFVPPGLAGYEPPNSELPATLDLERAGELLAEAGYPGGKGFPKISILFNTSESHKKIAEVIADQLRRNLGLPVEAHNQEWQAYQDSTRLLKYDIARAGWIGDYLDPNTFLDLWVTNGGNNQTGWGSPVYDRLIQAAGEVGAFVRDPDALVAKLREPDRARAILADVAASTDQAQRIAAEGRLRMHLFREAEAILVQDEFPVMPIYFYVVSGLVAPHVQGFYSELTDAEGNKSANLQDLHPVRGISLRAATSSGGDR